MLPLLIGEAAAEEFAHAVGWYETRRRRVPLQRMFVRRFPYQIVHRIEPDEICVIAVAHLEKRPGFWTRRG